MCEEFDNGVVKNGLHQAFQYYIDEATEILDHIDSINSAENGTKTYDSAQGFEEILFTEQYEKLHLLDEFYLEGLIDESVWLYSHHATDAIDHSENIMLALMLVLLVSVLFVYFIIVEKLVLELDNEVKRTRSLLLLVPDDILQTLPSLRRFLVKEVLGKTDKRKV